ncbi:MAG: hypothetical protein IPJ11_17470 [Gemmatimonadetes bacterium]|nr:hypothetical protein [Gemmatimonadota bacterium]
MLSREFYNVVHLVGVVALMAALGGVALHAMNGGRGADNHSRRFISILHGTGAFLILLGGFGMLARIGVSHGANFPPWLWVKVMVWIFLAAAPFLPYQRPAMARWLMLGLPVAGGVAAVMAIYKPWA